MSFRRRPVAVAAALYALLAVAMLGQGLFPGHTVSGSDLLWTSPPWNTARPHEVPPFGTNPELLDPVTVFQPFAQWARAHAPDVPLWNPHIMGGRPFAADQQSAVLSPFTIPSYLLPFWWSLSLVAALKLWVAAFGGFLLGRALGMRFPGAFTVGLAFGFSLWFVVWLPWPLTSVWAFLPWLLLATERLVRRPGPLPFAALALLTGLQYLGGHPESSFHTMFAVCAFFVLRLLTVRRADGGGPRAPIALFAGAMVVGAALAAVTLIPFLELVGQSGDVAKREAADPARIPRRWLLEVFLPGYFGRPTQTTLEGFQVGRALYAGILPLVLAGAALILRPRAERVAVAGFGLAMLAIVVGAPGIFDAVTALPAFGTAYNTRLVVVFVLAVALLAGRGLDDLCERAPSGRRAALLVAGAAALLVVPLAGVLAGVRPSGEALRKALEVAWGFAHPPGATQPLAGPVVHAASAIVAATFAALALALLAARVRGRIAAPAFAALAIALVAADLLRAGMGQNPAVPVARATQPVTGAIRHMRAHAPARFAGVLAGFGALPLPPDVGMRYGLYDARGYDYPVIERFDRLWLDAVAPPTMVYPPTIVADPNPRALRVLSLLGVRDLLHQKGEPPLKDAGLRLAYYGPDAQVYENDRALPRAVVAGSQHVVSGEAAARSAVAGLDFDGRRAVVVERRLPGLPESGPQGVPAGPAGTARIERYEPERVLLRVRATRPGEVVLSDVHYPGWRATVDGRPARLDRVNYLFRGVPVPAGEHVVEMRYRPASWRAGWIVSLLAVAVVAGVAAAGLRGRRRTREPVA
jgi:hypothetical protein